MANSPRTALRTDFNPQWDEPDLYTVFDEDSFFKQFVNDLKAAKESVIVQSPYMYDWRLDQFLSLFKELTARGVCICIFVQEAEYWARRHQSGLPPDIVSRLQQFNERVNKLRSLGVHVTIRTKAHEKLAVIDNLILWDGSLNSLSHRDTSERMTRWISARQAYSAAVKHRLDRCQTCWASPTYRVIGRDVVRARITNVGKQLSRFRHRLSLSQSEVQKLTHCDQSLISKLENGKGNINSEALFHVACSVGAEFLLVPHLLIHAMRNHLDKLLEDYGAIR